ncbi:alpha/beta hydrolase [Pseudoxanthomonas sp. SL93]|uniref:alpha/beta hydrolase family protein n=1 Tax=Pseudoxanthomonas sp. SL93 TaxID=2995142 RepID=UPI0022720949|nr:alpha/beta hydrolase [Pseudoxanthomonas sp. SL93]WAC61984.1 alpha/beta hydrolase [Pseudoxanthomonas sp. SL93]
MHRIVLLLLLMLGTLGATHAHACPAGVYTSAAGDFVVLVPVPTIPSPGLRYLFRDGRRGSTLDADAPLQCEQGKVSVRATDIPATPWSRLPLVETDATFSSLGTALAGRLIEPRIADAHLPLVVMVHGSERSPALASPYAYALAAQGIRVFVYDKRGTGASQGEYTQNFELLADDAAAALRQARAMAQGRYARAGYYGGSQGGWVAPLAATRAPADFVAVGFGLVVSPIDEDREQMIDEARAAGLGADAEAAINRLSDATARLLTTHFEDGFEPLEQLRRDLAKQPWIDKIHGEHSGAMLRTSDADLRRVGRARFDNLELIWDYDALAALERLQAPLLWVLAAQDREAPIERTRDALAALAAAGKPIDLYVFPDTDHGMFEFTTRADGSRQPTRVTDGYLRLLGDWIKGTPDASYGRGIPLTGKHR